MTPNADQSFFSRQPDTNLHCDTMDTILAYHAMCLFTPQLSSVSLRLATEGWPGWVDVLTYQDGLLAHRRSPIPVLTGTNVDQLC